MSTVKQAGTRIAYNSTLAGTLAAQGPLASIPSGWTLVPNILALSDLKPKDTNVFDDSSLEDTAQVVDIEYRAGMGSFTKKKNAVSPALFTLADAGTKVNIAVIYADGSAHVATSARFVCQSAGKANAGDFQHKVEESWQMVPDTFFVFQDHA